MRRIFFILSVFGITFLFFSTRVQEPLAQEIIQPTVGIDKNIFRIMITLFGVQNDTGNVLSFAKVNNATSAKYFDAIKEDKDRDGIVDTVLRFPNETVPTGANFTACSVILKDISMSCKTGIHVQGRTEVSQFALPTFKQSLK